MNRTNTRLRAPGRRALEKIGEETQNALKLIDRIESPEGVGYIHSVPTIIQKVVSIEFVGKPEVTMPSELADFQDRAINNSGNAHRAPALQLFSRKEGVQAHRELAMGTDGLLCGIQEALESMRINGFLETAAIERFRIFGVGRDKPGRRYVSALLDQSARKELTEQNGFVREALGLDPSARELLSHVSVFETSDQNEAAQVVNQCRQFFASGTVWLGEPEIKTVHHSPAGKSIKA